MASHPTVANSNPSEEWFTPTEILMAARSFLGEIDLDPASCAEANERVGATVFFSRTDDGLVMDWEAVGEGRGLRVWMNHPYHRDHNSLWVDKLVSMYERGVVGEACCLVYANFETSWFRPLRRYPMCLLNKRVKHVPPSSYGGKNSGSQKPSVVVGLTKRSFSFRDQFKHLGEVVGRSGVWLFSH